MDREPAVAGTFYPAQPDRLARQVSGMLVAEAPPERALGLLVPHAGYVYSGPVAGATYARAQIPPRALVLAPNHTGLGTEVALWPDGGFLTPLGRVPVDPELTAALRASPLVEVDRGAHLAEHALEVQLPFLQARRPDVAIAALVLGPLDVERALALGEAVAAAVRACPALLVASSDMSHYVPAAQARRQDERALARLLALDPRGLHDVCRREDISMCGVVPATVMLAAALALGARQATLVRYANSGDVTGDRSSVVGYAGALVS